MEWRVTTHSLLHSSEFSSLYSEGSYWLFSGFHELLQMWKEDEFDLPLKPIQKDKGDESHHEFETEEEEGGIREREREGGGWVIPEQIDALLDRELPISKWSRQFPFQQERDRDTRSLVDHHCNVYSYSYHESERDQKRKEQSTTLFHTHFSSFGSSSAIFLYAWTKQSGSSSVLNLSMHSDISSRMWACISKRIVIPPPSLIQTFAMISLYFPTALHPIIGTCSSHSYCIEKRTRGFDRASSTWVILSISWEEGGHQPDKWIDQLSSWVSCNFLRSHTRNWRASCWLRLQRRSKVEDNVNAVLISQITCIGHRKSTWLRSERDSRWVTKASVACRTYGDHSR